MHTVKFKMGHNAEHLFTIYLFLFLLVLQYLYLDPYILGTDDTQFYML
jgi:hypothetical protein